MNNTSHHTNSLKLLKNITFSNGQVKSYLEKAFCCKNSSLITLAISKVNF